MPWSAGVPKILWGGHRTAHDSLTFHHGQSAALLFDNRYYTIIVFSLRTMYLLTTSTNALRRNLSSISLPSMSWEPLGPSEHSRCCFRDRLSRCLG